jgi:hypothetical protein
VRPEILATGNDRRFQVDVQRSRRSLRLFHLQIEHDSVDQQATLGALT